MEQNNYRVPIEALPRDIQAIVQRRIQGSGQDVRLAEQMRRDRATVTKSTTVPPAKTSTIHPQKYAIREALRHVRAAWRTKGANVRQNTRFDVLQSKQPVVPPAKFTGHYSDLDRFLEDIRNYLDDTEVTSPKRQVLIALSRIPTDEWVDTMARTIEALTDDIPYVWNHFEQRFKERVYGQYRYADLCDQLSKLQMHNQKLEEYASQFEKLTNELEKPRDNLFFLALFIRGLTKQMRDTIRLHEVQTYEGLRTQVEENLLEMQREAEAKQAVIRTTFLRAHPELEGLEWHAPLIPGHQSRRAWKKEQRIARAFTPAYPPSRPASHRQQPYMPNRKSMTIRFYVHTPKEQAVETALIDSGATENFMHLSYAQKLQLPLKEMTEPQFVFNIDGTPNKDGEIKYYTDLNVQTGQDFTLFRFFLANTGNSKVILGYPWMCAIQPRIDWK